MLKKLPQWIVSKWADRIAEFQERNNDSFPPFADFVTFLSAQAKRCNNPVIVQLSSSSKPFSSTQEHKPSSTSVSNCISLSISIHQQNHVCAVEGRTPFKSVINSRGFRMIIE